MLFRSREGRGPRGHPRRSAVPGAAARGAVEDGARVQSVFISCPGVGKATYASCLLRLHGMPHITTGALIQRAPSKRAATICPAYRGPPANPPPLSAATAYPPPIGIPLDPKIHPPSPRRDFQIEPTVIRRTGRVWGEIQMATPD